MQKKKKGVNRLKRGSPEKDRMCEFATNVEEKQFFTAEVLSREDAIESKLSLLHGSFFGKPIMKFRVGEIRDVWVPYYYLKYHFCVERSVLFKKRGLEKTGEVAFVYDMNEMHPFQYDLYESGELALEQGRLNPNTRKILPCANSFYEAESKSEDYIQLKIMKKFYGREGQLTLQQKRKFYRPAAEIEIIYKGCNRNLRYAYVDEFAVESEHVLGLKYRVENNF